jgi:hypothetical protein
MTVQFLTVAQRRDSPRAAEKMATCCFELKPRPSGALRRRFRRLAAAGKMRRSSGGICRCLTERKAMAIDLKTVEELIREIELADPIDWGMLNIDEDDATRLIASSVVEHYEENIRPMSERERDYIVVSSIAKLTLENFVLNVKLARATGGQA